MRTNLQGILCQTYDKCQAYELRAIYKQQAKLSLG